MQDQLAECIEDPEQFSRPRHDRRPTTRRPVCEEMLLPRAEWFISRQPLDPSQLVRDLGTAVPMILSVLLLLAGATFVGADWNSGSMSNQLLFESRRTRVWAAKAGALALVAAVTGLVVQVLLLAGGHRAGPLPRPRALRRRRGRAAGDRRARHPRGRRRRGAGLLDDDVLPQHRRHARHPVRGRGGRHLRHRRAAARRRERALDAAHQRRRGGAARRRLLQLPAARSPASTTAAGWRAPGRAG